MRAPGAAGSGASAERFFHDCLDGADASPALGAAAETPINLPWRAWRYLRDAHRVAHVVVGQDVAGTNNHGWRGIRWTGSVIEYVRPTPDAKEKTVFSSDSKLRRSWRTSWNESKEVPAEQGPMIVASEFSHRRNFSVRLLGIQAIAAPTRLDRVAHAHPKWCGAIRIGPRIRAACSLNIQAKYETLGTGRLDSLSRASMKGVKP